MAEDSRNVEENYEKRKIIVPALFLDTVKREMHSSPASPVNMRKAASVRQNCLCSPTTHVGSFRCRYHRNGLTRNSMSVGAKLSEMAGKSPPSCDAFNNRLVSGQKQGT